MDLNEKGLYFSHNREFITAANSDYFGDTTLRLDCLGHGSQSNNVCRSSGGDGGSNNYPSDYDECGLLLGLGPATAAAAAATNYDARQSHQDEEEESPSICLMARQGRGLSDIETDSTLKLGISGGTTAGSEAFLFGSSPGFSALSAGQCDPSSSVHCHPAGPGQFLLLATTSAVDEGSTSAKQSGGYMPSLLFAPRMGGTNYQASSMRPTTSTDTLNLAVKPTSIEPSHLCTELPSGTPPISYTAGGSTLGTGSGPSPAAQHEKPPCHYKNAKTCQSLGCTKGARGASGFCIGHGGGQRCHKPGCNKGAESRTAYCKAHGGGRRCDYLGCTKSAEGKTDFCIAHGGGRRCLHSSGCTKAARGKSGLCIRHGGGKRCRFQGCDRSAEGQAGLCISHGGGRRCQFMGCTKGAQGSTAFCKAHGGGKRCVFAGCTKGAEGSTPLCKGHGGGKRCLFDGGGICPKSVHGGTNFCVAHGGGKRCAVTDCTKSARGRTDFCVRHGGGKRCKVENCGKSAQGRSELCKAHGGGKRCNWGGGNECDKFARGRSGLCASHTSILRHMGIDRGGGAKTSATIAPGLFRGIVVSSAAADASAGVNSSAGGYDNSSSSGVSVVSDGATTTTTTTTTEDQLSADERPPYKRHLLPPQVLVPLSMKSSFSYNPAQNTADKPTTPPQPKEVGMNGGERRAGRSSSGFVIPEGRVHGGGLMSLLGGNLNNSVSINR